MAIITTNELETSKLVFEEEAYQNLFNSYAEDLAEFISKTANSTSIAKNYFINQLVDKWQYMLGFNKAQIMQDIAEMQTPVSDAVKTLSVKEALQYHSSSASWLVPNLLRSSGLYILAGEPKAGKSLLLYFLMYAVSISGKFLGRPVKKGKVLYIQLEESLPTIGERLFYCGFGDALDDETSLSVNFGDTLLIEREFDITLDLDWLVKKIKDYEPSLVVIDSLRMASINSPYSENSNEFGKLVYRLQAVFNYTNTCGVLVHHMNKQGARASKNASLIERMSGHTSIAAASSGLIGIHREETEQGPLIVLKTLPRDGTAVTITYCLKTNPTGMWSLDKVWEDTPIGDPITGKILRFLYQQQVELGEDATFLDREIASKINCSASSAEYKKCLEFLTSSQLIQSRYKSGAFRYSLPLENQWLVNSPSIRESLDSSVIDANSVIRCQDKRDLQNLLKDWERDRINRAIAYLLPSEKQRIDDLACSAYFEVGDEVEYEDNVYIITSIVSSKINLFKTVYLLENSEESVEAYEVDIKLKGVVEKPVEQQIEEENSSYLLEIETLLSFSDDEDEKDLEDDDDEGFPILDY